MKRRLLYLLLLCIVIVIVAIVCVYAFPSAQQSHFTSYEMFGNMCGGNPHYSFDNSRSEGFANFKVGGNSYKIHEDLEDPEKAAELMDNLNKTATKLINHVSSKYAKDIDKKIHTEYVDRVEYGIKALKKNFKGANMEENIPERSGGDTSYVIDKGDVFAMCLRDPHKSNKIDENYNNLTFVLVHELSHIFSKTFGHDDIFWNNFKFLLQEAVEIGLYTPVNYKKNGSPYCGIVISYSPLMDPKLVDYKIE